MIMIEEKKNTMAPRPQEEPIKLQDLWAMFAPRWRWFLASMVVCVAGAMLYLLSTPNIYSRSASILVKDDKSGSSVGGSLSSEFSDLGMFKSNTNIHNELLTITSPTLMTEVVARLGLYETFTVRQGLKRVELYKAAPCVVTYMQPEDEPLHFRLKFTSLTHFELEDFTYTVDGQSVQEQYAGELGDTLQTLAGPMILTATPHLTEASIGKSFTYQKGRMLTVTDAYTARLQAALGNKDAQVINLSIDDASPRKAEDILNTLIAVYNEYWVLDKNQIAISTSKFITDRLGVIEGELGNVDENISSYKSQHLLPDVEAASKLYMEQSAEYKKEIQGLTNQLSIAQYIRRELTNKQFTQPLPANSGIDNSHIEQQISEYNKLVLDRNRLIANSSEKNPLVLDLTASLQSMKRAIVLSLDNLQVSLNTQIKSLRQEDATTTSQLASNPNQAKYLLSVERQQKVKSELYLYLLQKREENELSQAFTAYNTRVITAPRGSLNPTSPQKMKVLMMAFMLGLLAPAGLIFLLENLNTKVRGRKDLEKTHVPLVGEVPFYGKAPKRWGGLLQAKPVKQGILVKEGSRDMLNEAFRVMRSNLDFMSQGESAAQVFLTTSFNPGSGKSFLTANIGMSFLLKGKKVLLIDGDLRHASLSGFVHSPQKGITDYLGGRESQWKSLVVAHPDYAQLHVLPVGVVPPNPTELLENGRLADLIAEARQAYDLIFIDCPPIDIVADTQIISQVSDRTLFVVRAGLLERSMLRDLETLYQEKRFKGFCVILNGTETTMGRYHYRYGYHYGYHSGNYYSQQ